MKYRSEIDGLRALAVIPVIFFHAGFEMFSGGFVGVDVFFVISGYLITTIIINEMAIKDFSIINFYERRARRILPALFFVMAVSVLFAWLWILPNVSYTSDLVDFGESLVSVSTFTSNIFFWKETGYFANASELKPLIHTWSLAVEEQFYIIFPIFMLIIWKAGIKWVLFILILIFITSLSLAEWASTRFSSANFFLLPTRGWELLIGSFLAIFLKYKSHLKSHLINEILSLLGFCMILYSIVYFNRETPFPSLYTLIPTIGTALLILCSVSKTTIHKLLSLKLIVGVGLISYSTYLWHQPLLAFANYRFSEHITNSLLILICISSFLLAWFSWRYIERPFRNKEIVSRKRVFQFSFAGIMLFISIGFALIFNNGFENRNLNVAEIHHKLYWPTTNNISSECKKKYGGSQYCVVSDIEKPITAILFGDSHANHFYKGLEKYLNNNGDNLLMQGAGGCPPLIDIDMGFHYENGVNLNCYRNMNDLYMSIEDYDQVNTVYLAFAQHTLFDERLNFYDVRNEIDFFKNRYLAVKKALTRTIEFLSSKNIDLVIIEDLPDSNFNDYVSCLYWSNNNETCFKNLALQKNTLQYDQIINELEIEGFEILRTRDSLKYFPYTNKSEEKFLYRDNTHLSEAGSIHVIHSSMNK